MILIEHLAEVVVGAFKAADDFTMLREFPEDWMMKVHNFVFRLLAGCVRIDPRKQSSPE